MNKREEDSPQITFNHYIVYITCGTLMLNWSLAVIAFLQKTLSALLSSLINFDCLSWDCQPIHKNLASALGAVLFTAPEDFIHIWRY